MTATLPTTVAQPLASRVTFDGVLRSEWIKLSSLQSVRLTLAITVLAGLGINAAMAFNLRGDFEDAPAGALPDYLLMASTFAAPFLALVFGVLGVFSMASEYSSGMILSSLSAVPSRTPVLIAKALVLALLAAVNALILLFGGVCFAVVAIPEAVGQVMDPVVVSGVLGTAAYLVLISLLAFGIAGILRSTAGGIAVVVGLTFVLPLAFQMLANTGWGWVPTVGDFLPTPLGIVLSEGLVGADADSTTPDYWQALVAMGMWAAAPMAPAAILFVTRDAT